MEWSPQQVDAIEKVRQWLKGPDQVFRLFGYAGCGKTTIARYLGQMAREVHYAAFTGKAASVLRRSGCLNACTIHSLLYRPLEKSASRLRLLEEELLRLTLANDPANMKRIGQMQYQIAEEKKNLMQPAFSVNEESEARDADLICIDECSMIDPVMGQDLMNLGTKILVLGDPAQLPPVRGAGYFTNQSPDVLLTEIHRQAKGDPIIEIATAVRENGRLPSLGEYGASRICGKSSLTTDDWLAADQVIVGRNATRRTFNQRFRKLRGFTQPLPEKNDRLICLRNDKDSGLLNGTLWDVIEMVPINQWRLTLSLSSVDEPDKVVHCDAHSQIFLGEELPWEQRRKAMEFDYGYAITAHKAQGSQWDNVLVYDESGSFGAQAKNWLYTACTRAAKKVTIVDPYA